MTPVNEADGVNETPIENLQLSRRVINSLKRANVRKVHQVMAMSNGELLKIRNFGKKHLEELQGAIKSRKGSEGIQPADFGLGSQSVVA